jgi:pectate lyase
MKFGNAMDVTWQLLALTSLAAGCAGAGDSGSTTGGTSSTGGTVTAATGGTIASGGGVATGGATTSGGSASNGGSAMPAGGSIANGSSGGVGATGGNVSGGTKATGGNTTGGSVATGGSKATGGSSTGGSSTGGNTTGGSATGGAASSCPLELVGFATLDGGTTGGGNATPTTVTTQAELRACATAAEPRVCRVKGTLTFSPFEEIRVAANKTVIGMGANAAIVMGGFFVGTGIDNVIIRNLTIRDSFIAGQYDEGGDNGGDRDGVQLDTATHIWIDHCHFNHLGDGQIDSRKDTTLETVSWNILENHNKAFGIGWTENVTAQITIHHNWIHDTVQRNPSTDNVLRAHLFNNWLERLASYGNYARGATHMVLENSVFDTVKDPHYFDTGSLVAIDNAYTNSSGKRTSSGSSYGAFDPHVFYAYTLTPTEDVPALLRRCAGPRLSLGP